MLITTIQFWSLFIVFLLFFVLIRQASKWGMMLYVTVFSLAFYTFSTQWLMLMLPALGLFTWVSTRWMNHLEGRFRKEMMAVIIIFDLLPLVMFKYTGLIGEIWSALIHTNFSLKALVVPVGLSFFTFQAISYVVDVYKRKFTDEVSLLEFLFYLSFFPIVMSGPITRAETFFSHFRTAKNGDAKLPPVSTRLLYTGVWLIMLGLLKKLVVADYIAQYNNWVFDDPMAYSGFENLMGVVGYSVQIYCDFSGYSDMSIGVAALMGIKLPENFNLPYQSLNVTEFWHRWHISLSTWFRDYLYIPLGGNRKGKLRTYFNNFFTMFVAGMWHGSTPMFMLWGLLHGLGLVVHKMNRGWLKRIPDNWLTKPFSWLLTFVFLLTTWVFFRAGSLEAVEQIGSQIFTNMDLAFVEPFVRVRPLWVMLVVGSLLFHTIRRESHHRMIRWYIITPWIIKVALFLIVVQLCIQMHTSDVQPFIYSQF